MGFFEDNYQSDAFPSNDTKSRIKWEYKEVEDQRKITEHKRALADMEYRRTMGMSPTEYIQMRTLEVIENKPNANIDVLFGASSAGSMWDVKKK